MWLFSHCFCHVFALVWHSCCELLHFMIYRPAQTTALTMMVMQKRGGHESGTIEDFQPDTLISITVEAKKWSSTEITVYSQGVKGSTAGPYRCNWLWPDHISLQAGLYVRMVLGLYSYSCSKCNSPRSTTSFYPAEYLNACWRLAFQK